MKIAFNQRNVDSDTGIVLKSSETYIGGQLHIFQHNVHFPGIFKLVVVIPVIQVFVSNVRTKSLILEFK